MAKQLGLYQCIWDSSAVERDHLLTSLLASLMQGFGHQFFTRTGFTHYQNICICRCDLVDSVEQYKHVFTIS